MNGFHHDGMVCMRQTCALDHTPKAPVLEANCPRCKKGALVEMTGYADQFGRCVVYLACESCSYEREIGVDSVF